MDRKTEKLRRKHLKRGHPYEKSVRVDKLQSFIHPKTDDEFVYTVNLMICNECGLCWNDCGVERRKP
jgi:NAD-dependent dihydropyrimidine dehydrogenase PreA subunit